MGACVEGFVCEGYVRGLCTTTYPVARHDSVHLAQVVVASQGLVAGGGWRWVSQRDHGPPVLRRPPMHAPTTEGAA